MIEDKEVELIAKITSAVATETAATAELAAINRIQNRRELDSKKELWMWRGAAIFLLIINIVFSTQIALEESVKRGQDNKERAENWTAIRSGLESNRRMIYNVDEHLRQCLGCHSHALAAPTNTNVVTSKK
jgi:hypothetical protein